MPDGWDGMEWMDGWIHRSFFFFFDVGFSPSFVRLSGNAEIVKILHLRSLHLLPLLIQSPPFPIHSPTPIPIPIPTAIAIAVYFCASTTPAAPA